MSSTSVPNSPSPTTIIGKRYALQETLGTGGMGIVYRAQDLLTGEQVALKRVMTPAEQLRFGSSSGSSIDIWLSLAQEFRTLAALRHPNIISVLDYGFDDSEGIRLPYFTMELLNQPQTILEAGKNAPLETKIALLIETLSALAYLHRRGIIHRDVKPGNVLVVRENGKFSVRVLDFGLSSQSADGRGALAGTLAYLAPEALQTAPISERADLYAVGVIAYELFAGQHPFYDEDVTRMIHRVLTQPPDLSVLTIEPAMVTVLHDLLAKQPAERIASATDAIVRLCTAAQMPLPHETAAARENLLQTAPLIGRDEQVNLLLDQLSRSLVGLGSAWLVAGESGVGKSRLLDELRTLGMVTGAPVLRGHARAGGGKPYEVWLPVLRWLTLLVDITDTEATILRALIPDMETLLRRPLPHTAELDPGEMQPRLMAVIEEILHRQHNPLVIILEDLQWAGEESLLLLDRVSRSLDNLPLLVVGSYREDETPALHHRLMHMELMRLERLTDAQTAELSAAMLGEAGRQPQVVDLLQRETEGNIFFIIEVVRALAEEAGEIDRIGMITLPERVFAGGIDNIVQRRLERVPDYAQPLLLAAAVGGRELDPPVLAALSPALLTPSSAENAEKAEINKGRDAAAAAQPLSLDQWLATCADVAVLEVHDNRWRFAHDKLREGLLASLPAEHRRELHRQYAAALERVYPDHAQQAAPLAYHWKMAGDRAKEAYYTAWTGEQALRTGLYREALLYLERALELATIGNAPAIMTSDSAQDSAKGGARGEVRISLLRQAYLKRRLAEVHTGIGEYREARSLYQESVAICQQAGDQKGQADSLHALGVVAQVLDEWENAESCFLQCLALYRQLDDQPGIIKTLDSLGNLAFDRGEDEQANHFFRESLTIAREMGAGYGMAGSIGSDAQPRKSLAQYKTALRAALEQQNTPAALLKLTEMADFIKSDQPETALHLLALALHHPQTPDAAQKEAERILFELEDVLPPQMIATLWSSAKEQPFEAVLEALLLTNE